MRSHSCSCSAACAPASSLFAAAPAASAPAAAHLEASCAALPCRHACRCGAKAACPAATCCAQVKLSQLGSACKRSHDGLSDEQPGRVAVQQQCAQRTQLGKPRRNVSHAGCGQRLPMSSSVSALRFALSTGAAASMSCWSNARSRSSVSCGKRRKRPPVLDVLRTPRRVLVCNASRLHIAQ